MIPDVIWVSHRTRYGTPDRNPLCVEIYIVFLLRHRDVTGVIKKKHIKKEKKIRNSGQKPALCKTIRCVFIASPLRHWGQPQNQARHSRQKPALCRNIHYFPLRHRDSLGSSKRQGTSLRTKTRYVKKHTRVVTASS